MSKKAKVTKSQRIRDYHAENPEAKPTEAAKDLKKYGISANLYSNVLSEDKRKGRKGSVAKRTKSPASRTASRRPQTRKQAQQERGPIVIDEVAAAKRFVEEEFDGDLQRAETAVERLRTVQLA